MKFCGQKQIDKSVENGFWVYNLTYLASHQGLLNMLNYK